REREGAGRTAWSHGNFIPGRTLNEGLRRGRIECRVPYYTKNPDVGVGSCRRSAGRSDRAGRTATPSGRARAAGLSAPVREGVRPARTARVVGRTARAGSCRSVVAGERVGRQEQEASEILAVAERVEGGLLELLPVELLPVDTLAQDLCRPSIE